MHPDLCCAIGPSSLTTSCWVQSTLYTVTRDVWRCGTQTKQCARAHQILVPSLTHFPRLESYQPGPISLPRSTAKLGSTHLDSPADPQWIFFTRDTTYKQDLLELLTGSDRSYSVSSSLKIGAYVQMLQDNFTHVCSHILNPRQESQGPCRSRLYIGMFYETEASSFEQSHFMIDNRDCKILCEIQIW